MRTAKELDMIKINLTMRFFLKSFTNLKCMETEKKNCITVGNLEHALFVSEFDMI